MSRCLNALWLLLFVSAGAIGGDEASQSVDMTFTVNIEPPMCKLDNATLDVDFGEFQIFDIIQGNVKKRWGSILLTVQTLIMLKYHFLVIKLTRITML